MSYLADELVASDTDESETVFVVKSTKMAIKKGIDRDILELTIRLKMQKRPAEETKVCQEAEVVEEEPKPECSNYFWSTEEHLSFISQFIVHGHKWKKIAKSLNGTRSTMQVRTHGQKYIKSMTTLQS